VKISYRRSGGIAYFPGRAAALSVDTAELPATQAERLERLCADARVFERPPAPRPPPGAADTYTYTLTVQQGRRRRTLQLHDPVEGEELRALLSFLDELQEGGALPEKPSPLR
jgi:hypothetical protein